MRENITSRRRQTALCERATKAYRVCNEETDVVARKRLSPKDDKLLGALAEEARELVRKNGGDVVLLQDRDRNPHRVDRRLNIAHLVLCAADADWVQQKLLARRLEDFRLVHRRPVRVHCTRRNHLPARFESGGEGGVEVRGG